MQLAVLSSVLFAVAHVSHARELVSRKAFRHGMKVGDVHEGKKYDCFFENAQENKNPFGGTSWRRTNMVIVVTQGEEMESLAKNFNAYIIKADEGTEAGKRALQAPLSARWRQDGTITKAVGPGVSVSLFRGAALGMMAHEEDSEAAPPAPISTFGWHFDGDGVDIQDVWWLPLQDYSLGTSADCFSSETKVDTVRTLGVIVGKALQLGIKEMEHADAMTTEMTRLGVPIAGALLKAAIDPVGYTQIPPNAKLFQAMKNGIAGEMKFCPSINCDPTFVDPENPVHMGEYLIKTGKLLKCSDTDPKTLSDGDDKDAWMEAYVADCSANLLATCAPQIKEFAAALGDGLGEYKSFVMEDGEAPATCTDGEGKKINQGKWNKSSPDALAYRAAALQSWLYKAFEPDVTKWPLAFDTSNAPLSREDQGHVVSAIQSLNNDEKRQLMEAWTASVQLPSKPMKIRLLSPRDSDDPQVLPDFSFHTCTATMDFRLNKTPAANVAKIKETMLSRVQYAMAAGYSDI